MVQPSLFFEPRPFPGLPGPAVGPKGPKLDQKPGAGFIISISLRSAQGPPGGGGAKHNFKSVLKYSWDLSPWRSGHEIGPGEVSKVGFCCFRKLAYIDMYGKAVSKG